jgi:K+-sensing histidine kinase KdpD
MNSIVGMIYLMKQTTLSKTQKKYLDHIDSSSNNLLNLINDILDLSKIEAKKMKLSNTHFNLIEVLNNINNLLRIQADEKGITFKIIYNKSENQNLYGDDLKLFQILNNLTHNAIKFTEKGGVELIVEKLSDARYKFTVTDTGIGLTKNQIDKLFLSFTQADDGTTRKYGGTGLGLAITKELIQLMNGKILVESKYGKGSKFIFEIDLKTYSNKKITNTKNISRLKEKQDIKDKIVLNDSDSKKLILKLKDAVNSRRPNRCQPIIEEIELYALNSSQQELFEKIKKLIRQYKFNEAMELLNEK